MESRIEDSPENYTLLYINNITEGILSRWNKSPRKTVQNPGCSKRKITHRRMVCTPGFSIQTTTPSQDNPGYSQNYVYRIISRSMGGRRTRKKATMIKILRNREIEIEMYRIVVRIPG